MPSKFDRLAQQAGEVLLMDPNLLGPDEPTGLWFCDCPETVYTVQINAVCLQRDASWDDVPRCLDFIRCFKYVVIVSPSENERRRMVEELRPRLPALALYVVEARGFRGCRTMRQYADAYGPSAIRDVLIGAVELPAYGLVNLAQVQSRDMSKVPRALSGLDKLDRGIGGFFAGEVSVWTGKRGSGKSTMLSQLLLEAVDQGHRVCAYSGELNKEQFREWIDLQAAGPDRVSYQTDKRTGKRLAVVDELTHQRISQWLDGQFWLFDLDCGSVHDEDQILAQFEYAHLRYGTDVFLVDNIMTVQFRQGRDSDYYRAQSNFVGRLVAFAKQHGAHVHMVAHPRKSEPGRKDASADDVGGSGDITNRADNVFLMRTVTLEEDGRQTTHPCLEIFKNRDFGGKGHINLSFDARSRRFYELGGAPDKTFGWALAGEQVTFRELAPQEGGDPWCGSETG